ncbi:MAG: hypothetical protein AAF597_06715, partial [Bacteroidota bacterium]
PETTYYFKIKDSEGSSKTYSFQTAPASPYGRLSIIAGGDSRNHRNARISEAPNMHLPVVMINAGSRGATNFLNLAEEFLKKNEG